MPANTLDVNTTIAGPLVEWRVLSPSGPSQAHHVTAYVGGILYSHGGVTEELAPPSNRFYKYEQGIWSRIYKKGLYIYIYYNI